jgi:chromate transporter
VSTERVVGTLRNNHALSSTLMGITAAVVGVIANLAVYFAVHTLFATTTHVAWGPIGLQLPVLTSWRAVAVVIALTAATVIFVFKWSVLRTLGICAVLGGAAALAHLPIT